MRDLAPLQRLPEMLGRLLREIDPPLLRTRHSSGAFALVEHLWHLADLEAEGFGARLARLRDEDAPHLPDFRGDVIARERDYLARDAAAGLAAFAQARWANLAAFAALSEAQWGHAGTQQGVGPIVLADLPRAMLDHDRGHAAEMTDLLGEIAPSHALRAELAHLHAGPAS
jgi:hypothetical protein